MDVDENEGDILKAAACLFAAAAVKKHGIGGCELVGNERVYG